MSVTEDTTGSPTSSSYAEHGHLLQLQTNSRWALLGFLIVLPVMSAVVLVIYTRMERKKTNVLNIQLASVNLFSAVVLLPLFFSFYQIFAENGLVFINGIMKMFLLPDEPRDDRAVNRSFCISLALCYYLTSSLHFLTLLGLSVDRFTAIFFPFPYRRVPVKHYQVAIVAMWVVMAALPLPGFVTSRIDDEEGVRPPYFEYYPYPITYHQEAFCEIHFSSILMTGYDRKDLVSIGQKVYCFILMGIPFIISPLITIVLSVATLFRLTRISMKQKRLRSENKHFPHPEQQEAQTTSLLNCGKIMKTFCRAPKNSQEVQLHEMYENRTNITTTVDTDYEGSEQTANYSYTEGAHRSKKVKVSVHLQAFLTLVLLLFLFLLCDSLWWLTTIGDTVVYLLGRTFSPLSYTGLLSSETQLVVWPITARLGPFLYGLLVPCVMLWRQKPFREQFLSIFRDAKIAVTELTVDRFHEHLPNSVA